MQTALLSLAEWARRYACVAAVGGVVLASLGSASCAPAARGPVYKSPAAGQYPWKGTENVVERESRSGPLQN